MPRKVYDVKPPKLTRKTEGNIKEFLKETKKRPSSASKKKDNRVKPEKQRFFPWRKVGIGVGVVVVLACIYLFFKLPKANVEIWPKVEILSFEEVVTADTSVDEIDFSSNTIPAKYFEQEKSGSQEFESTGNASDEGKAKGTITIYNKYDPVTLITLKVGTHFLSDSGKYFITLKRVTIPAGKKSGNKVTPGSVKVEVEAVEGGEGYNIGPATFSVPKLSGTAYYYSIYAESSEAMSGGFAGKIKKVLDDDIDLAKDSLTKKLIAETEAELKNNLPEGYMLLDEMIYSEIISASTDTESGTVTDSFTYEAKIESRALAFKKSDLEKFAKDYIVSQMPESETLLESTFKADCTASKTDIDKEKTTLNLNFSSGIYQDINKNYLIPLLVNKNEDQIKETVKDNLADQVSDVKVNLWPFWVTKSPGSQKAVKIELKFN